MVKLHVFNMWQYAGEEKGVLKTWNQDLVIEEVNLSKKPSCSHLFLTLTTDWGYTKMDMLRTFICETYQLCLHYSTCPCGIFTWQYIALEKTCVGFLYVTSFFSHLQFLWHPGYLMSAVVQNCNASLFALELRLCITFRLIQMKQELAGFPASHSSLCSSSFICGLGEEIKINQFINTQVQQSASFVRINNFNYNV